MINAQQVQQFQHALATASWKLDLWAFADALGSDASHDYTQEKFRQLNAANKALSQFDAETLARVINAVQEG